MKCPFTFSLKQLILECPEKEKKEKSETWKMLSHRILPKSHQEKNPKLTFL
jgi:hypothetical protein